MKLGRCRWNEPAKGFTLIELLVVIAIIGIIAGVLLPSLGTGRREAYKVACGSNLKNIYTFAALYGDRTRTRKFPIASGAEPEAHASIQKMIDKFSGDFKPEMFNCAEAETTLAEKDDDGNFVLDVSTNAYAWVGRATKTSAKNRVLTSDKYYEGYEDDDGIHEGHADGMQSVSTDGSVTFLNTSELEEDTGLPRGLVR